MASGNRRGCKNANAQGRPGVSQPEACTGGDPQRSVLFLGERWSNFNTPVCKLPASASAAVGASHLPRRVARLSPRASGPLLTSNPP